MQRSFVNCWHVSEHESVAMWKLYSTGAYTVAIRSTVGRLKEILKPKGSDVSVYWVDYIDHKTDKQEWNNLMLPLFTKRIHFKHENELRVVWTLDKQPEQPLPGIGMSVDMNQLIEAVYASPYDPPWFEGVVKTLLERLGFDSSLLTASVLNEEPSSIVPLPSDAGRSG